MRRTPMEMSSFRQAKRHDPKFKRMPACIQKIALTPHGERPLWLSLPKCNRGYRKDNADYRRFVKNTPPPP